MPNLALMEAFERSAKSLKPQQIRIRVNGEDATTLNKLAGDPMSLAIVASALLNAACIAIRQNEGRLTFPPQFSVKEFAPRFDMNEEKKSYGKKK